MINRMVLQGRLTRDPELRTTQSGISVVGFTVAWSEKYKENETQLFLNCTAWRNTADMVSKYFEKGKEIVVEGQLSTRKYTDKDGNDRSVTELTVDKVHFCGPKDGNSGATGSGGHSALSDPSSNFLDVSVSDEDLPF